MSTTIPVREASRDQTQSISDTTKGFFLGEKGKEVFVTVTEPDYSPRMPKGTIMYFHGPGEFSELMSEQVEQWTDAGYRVVTFDQPGAGLSSKDAKIGSERLLHMNSIQEQAVAASNVVQFIQDKYRDTQNGRLHFVSNSTGALVAMETTSKVAAGSIGSFTAVSPVLDVELGVGDYGRSWRGIFDKNADPDRISSNPGSRELLVGGRVTAKEKEFFKDPLHQNRTDGPLTKGYVAAVESYLNRINSHRDGITPDLIAKPFLSDPDIKDVLKRNNINFGVVTDPTTSITGNTTQEWLSRYNIPSNTTLVPGGGVDLIHSRDHKAQVLGAIEENIDGCLFVKVENGLKTVSKHEWDSHTSDSSRRAMQKMLIEMGYEVGPNKTDGVPSHGAVADTEHAMTRFLMTYLDKKNIDIGSFKFTPENIVEKISEAHKAGFKMPSELDIRTDKDYDHVKGELDHAGDGHHLTIGKGTPKPVVIGGRP